MQGDLDITYFWQILLLTIKSFCILLRSLLQMKVMLCANIASQKKVLSIKNTLVRWQLWRSDIPVFGLNVNVAKSLCMKKSCVQAEIAPSFTLGRKFKSIWVRKTESSKDLEFPCGDFTIEIKRLC